MLYLAIQVGICRHTIVALTSTLELAKSKAEEFLRLERDDYYQVEIIEIELDKGIEGKTLGELVRKDEKIWTEDMKGNITISKRLKSIEWKEGRHAQTPSS